MNYQERITANSKVVLGKPVIKNTRITVELILRKIGGGFSFEGLNGNPVKALFSQNST